MDIISVCKRYFKRCLEGLQIARLAGQASCILPYLGLFQAGMKLANAVQFPEGSRQLCTSNHEGSNGGWKGKARRCGRAGLWWESQATWVSFHHVFSEERAKPGGSTSAASPCVAALGCGRWVPKNPGKRCSHTDSHDGTGAGRVTQAAIAPSLLVPRPGAG